MSATELPLAERLIGEALLSLKAEVDEAATLEAATAIHDRILVLKWFICQLEHQAAKHQHMVRQRLSVPEAWTPFLMENK